MKSKQKFSPGLQHRQPLPWSNSLLWAIYREGNYEATAARLGVTRDYVRKRMKAWLAVRPGGDEGSPVFDDEINRTLISMLDGARLEVLGELSFVRRCRDLFDSILGAARRGVEVELVFRPESLNSLLASELAEAGVIFWTLPFIHSKLLVADNTALESSANLNSTSSFRNEEAGGFHTDLAWVDGYRSRILSTIERGRLAARP